MSIHNALTITDIEIIKAKAEKTKKSSWIEVNIARDDVIELCRFAIERLQTLSKVGKTDE